MSIEKEFANRLINETSPYLLQHAHNPVDWYPWGEEAFARAVAEDKPVLVSIGYSACHWCHVMEHESFEDEATAAAMNEHFINIKVDMEERPDVDQIYMSFVQLTTGRGGWPMNVFLTPDKRPFFGGTYFPPAPRYGMPSWRQILTSIAEAYRERREELESSAAEILAEMRRISTVTPAGGVIDEKLLERAFESFVRSFDTVNGGFGGAPKFPPAMSLEFLMRYHRRTGDEQALEIVRQTLRSMAFGGIHDQLGGGFHRYTVDAIWLVPHFEKMLYDNAQLVSVYLHGYQITGDELFKRVAIDTLEYIKREMLDASGGFYSSQDADSEGEEGKFFVWTQDEIEQLLGNEAAAAFNSYYDVSAAGNFEGNSILNVANKKLREDEGYARFADARRQLFGARERRIKPGRDEKVLTAWNGLMLSAFAEAAAVLGDAEYMRIAIDNAEFLLSSLRQNGRVLRTWKDGTAKLNGYLEDVANLADGLLSLYRATGEARYLAEARGLGDSLITEFWDEEDGGFFFTSNDHEELVVRNKDFYDNATPSGNSVAADVLLKLAKITGDARYENFGIATLRLAASQVRRHPQGFGRALSAMEFYVAQGPEIAVIGPAGNELERIISTNYLPDAVVAFGRGDSSENPMLDARGLVDGRPAAYVCRHFVCERPITDAEELRSRVGDGLK